jgi:hypothetical protein
MWTTIMTVLLSFILTGVIGSSLLHAWQRRHWLEQQRLLDREREVNALQELFDDVALFAGKRQYRMVRLLLNLGGKNKESVNKCVEEYGEAVVAWNERLNTLYAKTTILASWKNTKQLEEIQETFVYIGHKIEKMTSDYSSGMKITPERIKKMSDALSGLQGKIGKFHKGALRFIDSKKEVMYKDVELTERNLYGLPTGKLFKALFKPRVEGIDII